MSLSYTSTLTSCLRQSVEKDTADITLNLALRNPKLFDLFRKFLQLEMSEENLDFYIGNCLNSYTTVKRVTLAVEKLQTSKSRKAAKVRTEVERIYQTHLVPGSEFEINVGPEVRRQIDRDLQNENYDSSQVKIIYSSF